MDRIRAPSAAPRYGGGPAVEPALDPPVLGVIGGSSVLKGDVEALRDLRNVTVVTPHGPVAVKTGFLPGGGSLVFCQRHEAIPGRGYNQPAEINYASIALAMKKLGCQGVIGICSVGSLRPGLAPGSVVVPDDYYSPAELIHVYDDHRSHFLPEFDARWREEVIEALHELRLRPHVSGSYVNSRGPRFETKSEIRMFAHAGAVLGMTGAHEASVLQEVGLPYAMVCVVDNYCNGIAEGLLSLEDFQSAQARNRALVDRILSGLLRSLGGVVRYQYSMDQAEEAEDGGEGSNSGYESDEPSSGVAAAGERHPQHVDLLIHARYVVPVIPEETVLEHHCVAVHEGRIVRILPSGDVSRHFTSDRTHYLEEHALIPGMVNAHTHLPMNHLRGLADDMPLMEWLSTAIWPTEGRLMSPEFCRSGTTLALAESIRAGVTCVNDMYFFPDCVAKEMERVGMRGRVGFVTLDFPTAWGKDPEEYLSKARQIATEWRERSGGKSLVDFCIAPHAPYTVSDSVLEQCRDFSAEFDVPFHVHLHETEMECRCSEEGIDGPARHRSSEHARPVANFDRMGIVNERLIAVHMTQVNEDELVQLREKGASVVHCPSSNMKTASGFCPVHRLTEAGVNVAIGTDGSASNNTLDMFAEMKLAALLAKGFSGSATAVPAWKALRMATLNGAKAMHLDREIGSIEAGKCADLTAVHIGGIEQRPMYDVVSHLVYVCSRNCVTHVWCNGVSLLEHQKLQTMDEAAIVPLANEWERRVKPPMDATPIPGIAREDEGETGSPNEVAARARSGVMQ